VCSHVAALLFKVEASCRLGYNKPSCTSQPCLWNQTFKTKVGLTRCPRSLEPRKIMFNLCVCVCVCVGGGGGGGEGRRGEGGRGGGGGEGRRGRGGEEGGEEGGGEGRRGRRGGINSCIKIMM
jgi:hypothetical protein